MTQFTGLLVRDYFTDTGVIPTQGGVNHSPDIIPYQTSTLSPALAASSYGGPTDIGKALVSNSVNNIYVRCKNLGSSTTGTVNLYYCLSSLLMQPVSSPGGWLQNTVGTAGGTYTPSFIDATNTGNGGTVAQNDVGLVNPSFYVSSFPTPPPNQHYCLIAASSTPEMPFEPPQSNFTSNAAFVNWVQQNPNVAWRNVTYVQPTNNNSTYVMVTNFGNSNPTTTTLTMAILASNYPANTAVNFQSSDNNFPFNETVYLPQAGSDGSQNTSLLVPNVPADYAGTFQITVTAPSGTTFNAGAPLQVQQIQEVGADATELEKQVARSKTIHRPQPDGTVRPETVQALLMGEINLYVGGQS